MVNVCIQKDLFPAGESLFGILAMRMATVNWCEAAEPVNKKDAASVAASPHPVDVFSCSGAFAKKRGGVPAVIEMARSMRAASPP